VGFPSETPTEQAKQKLLTLSCEVDSFHLNDREIYWLRCGMFNESEISGALLEKTVGMRATFRNSTTVKRIAAKYS